VFPARDQVLERPQFGHRGVPRWRVTRAFERGFRDRQGGGAQGIEHGRDG
jgi:hypothetical protein